MESNTTSLFPSEEAALACYRSFRDAGHLPPVMAAKTRTRPSKALDRARGFAMAVREAAFYEDEMSRMDALHDAGAGLTGEDRAALDWMIDRDATTASNPMIAKAVGLGELLTEPDEPVRWLVEDVLPAGGSSLVVAPPKAGKTTLARCLAVAVARGLAWLGRDCSRGPVLYLALEERRDEVKRHFAKLGARADDQIRVYVQPAPRDGLAALRGAVLAFKPALVIVDPLFRLIRFEDGNDYAGVTNALEPLVALGRETGAHLMLVHHSRKGSGEDGEESLGSQALFAAVDSLLSIRRSGIERSIESRQRYGPDMPRTVLALDESTGWVNVGVQLSEIAAAKTEDAILDFVASHEGAVAHKIILEEVEGRRERKVRALRSLAESGRLHRFGSGNRKDPMLYSVPHSQL